MTPIEQWAQVDRYIVDCLVEQDDPLLQALDANSAAGLPDHDVAPNQGKLLQLFARMVNARRILEIGTLGGYSTIWLARALPPDGTLVTLEANERHAAVARRNVANAGLSAQVALRVGPALLSLPQLQAEAPFDLIFIDADKPGNPDYLQWALRLSRPGTAIVGDNVVRNGAVTDAASKDASVQGVRRFFDMMAQEPRLSATALQTVGSKGWDGFSLAIVNY
ncbi:Putative O-methyltransferase MSMEG_5073 [Serratia entomophila]|jgi:predicted O-methyltransferase YrrM|uniref:O-methyltransferase n=1 Tax=Serratia entomophila TaxID=42906 RepID=A0ABY5CYS6_9GAMM|nr:O-methyltransferase [Serratia entomophila]UIW20486.1 O-methyltransferase [Serratia entomophila]USV02988.1 O-methyltransferase [Serratia entomophila]CAI0693630.1 Putative O-methyltransferase MSMEG_5073 [Serratia entomophila]CAI0702242.1 Putative O-methyltransferase MSMEG_5073 [Serratia entomophila]CAI0731117.1 Putative O-methyltransferase MSMEG_5073 [Serratia entomophila]